MDIIQRLKNRKPRREPIDIPEWQENGEQFFIRVLSGEDQYELEEWMGRNRGHDLRTNNLLVMCKLCVLALVGANGDKIFPDEDAAIDALRGQEWYVLSSVSQKIMRLNRMTKEDQEELARNFPRAAASSSGIDSPNGSACPSGAA